MKVIPAVVMHVVEREMQVVGHRTAILLRMTRTRVAVVVEMVVQVVLGGNGWFSFGLTGGHGGTALQTYSSANLSHNNLL